MELEQYNIKAFQDGLEDILKNPWKKPVYIQDTIPTFPEESNDKDRTIHDLIKVMFVYKRLVCPYYSTVGHLCLNKPYFLKYVLETYSKKEEFSILFKGTSRLTSHQIYEAFYGMSPNNASFLLDRIDCPVSVYTKLKDALESREELKFAEAIDECDISNILPALKFVLFVKNQVKQLDGLGSQNNEAVDSDFETEKLKTRYKAENEMTEKFDVSPSSKFNQENKAFFDELLRLMKNPNELLESFYLPLFCQYCQMKKGGGLNDSDVKAVEYIFHQPAFEEQYERCMKLWETGELEGMFTKRSEKNNLGEEVSKEGFDSVAANKKEQQLTSQIKEPAAEEGKDTPILVKNDFIEQEPTKEKGHLFPDSKYGFIPEDYFEPGCISKGHFEEHYELVNRVKEHGLPVFVDFINYIAKEGFIENDDETKALLAYRLTGRMRPEKLDAIPWFKEKGEPKELYYIIKYFSPRNKTKFSKQMKDYFENEYFGVADYSRTAEDVSDDFKKKLEDFFPGLTNTRKG